MNKIIEALEFASDSYWGDPERFKFKATISTFTPTVELSDNSERIVKCTLSITLYGYIIPDIPQKDLNSIKKFSEKNKLTFTTEIVGGGTETFNANVNQTVKQKGGLASFIDSPNIVNKSITTIISSSVDTNTLIYINTSKALQATTVTIPDTAVFAGAFLTAPTGLPATSATSFSYFVNGQLVEPNAVTSFVDNGGNTCTLTVNTTNLGFTLQSTDEVVAIGKFA